MIFTGTLLDLINGGHISDEWLLVVYSTPWSFRMVPTKYLLPRSAI